MEDVLAVYRRPYDRKRPVVCMDEISRQLLQQVRSPIEMHRGVPYREYHHYRRNGTASLPAFFEPLAAWRTVMIRRRRTKVDWARCIRRLLVDHDPMAERDARGHGQPEHPSSIEPLRSVRACGSQRSSGPT
jgi:hypothetical protein